MTLAIITAIYDDYDTLKPICPQVGTDVEWICVTDNPELKNEEAAAGWDVVYEPRTGLHPNRAAKFPKMLPWRYTGAAGSVWLDASFTVVSPNFALEAVTLADPIAQFVHPWRDCVYDEADVSHGMAKYAGEPTVEQSLHNRETGHPAHWGLWATGVIARRHTAPVGEFGVRWLLRNLEWSFQDQLSEAPSLRESHLRPVSLTGNHLDNPWLHFSPSGRH